MTQEKKLSWGSIIGYGFGEAGSQLSWTLIGTYLTAFYTDVVGLTPAIIAGIMLFARIWDAINDPMFGTIAENYTHTRWGRFRPYIMFGAPVLALFNCLTFLNLDIAPMWKTIWCGATYIGCGMAYTAVSISVGSLANCMTAVNTERVTLNSSRNIIGNAAALIVNAVAMPLILFFGKGSASSSTGYFMAAVVLSVAIIPCLLICSATTRETIGVNNTSKDKKKESKGSLYASFATALKDRNSLMLILAMVTVLTAVMGRVGIMFFYFAYVYGDPTTIASCGTALTFGMIIPGFYAPFLLNRFDKKWVGVGACIAMALSCVALYICGEVHVALPLLVVVHFIYGASNCAALTCFSLIAEVVDDAWIRTGHRNDGTLYSMVSFGTKLGNAIGGSVGILALGAVGYVANAELSAATLSNMNKVINFGPAAIFILAGVFFSLITMTNKLGRENEEKVKEMMAASASSEG